MQTAPLVIPRHIVQQRVRPPKKNIPPTPVQRHHILHAVRNYVAEYNPVPPLPVEELKVHAERVVETLKCDSIYRDYIGVLINNEMWRETLASVPYERRLLLLPKCLRVESKCPAPFDEFGLLCKQCGLCTIQDLQSEAEKLGYAVLVAEGSAIVMSLIQTGKIEAIVGVSCLSVLERAFPYMEAAAIPGVADLAVAGDGGDEPGRAHLAHPLAAILRDEEVATRVQRNIGGAIQAGIRGQAGRQPGGRLAATSRARRRAPIDGGPTTLIGRLSQECRLICTGISGVDSATMEIASAPAGTVSVETDSCDPPCVPEPVICAPATLPDI